MIDSDLTLYALSESTPGYLPDEVSPCYVLGLGEARVAAASHLCEVEAGLKSELQAGRYSAPLLALVAACEALPAEGDSLYFDHPASPGLGRVLSVTPLSPGDLEGEELEEILIEAEVSEACARAVTRLYAPDCDGLGTGIDGDGYYACLGCEACEQGHEEWDSAEFVR